MALVKKIRQRRAEAKKAIKAAQARARQEVKEASKASQKREKLLAKQEQQLLKAEQKGLKRKRAHDLEMAKLEYQKRKEGKVNPKKAKKALGTAQVIVPVLAPLAYRAFTAGRGALENAKAKRAGVTPEQLAQFSGYGAPLKARIQGVRDSLTGSSLTAGAKHDLDARLAELSSAVSNAEFMPPEKRHSANKAIERDLDRTIAEIQQHLRHSK